MLKAKTTPNSFSICTIATVVVTVLVVIYIHQTVTLTPIRYTVSSSNGGWWEMTRLDDWHEVDLRNHSAFHEGDRGNSVLGINETISDTGAENSSPQDTWGSQEGGKNYMFALRITEQLTMSTRHFHQFLNLVNDWNFTGVEPFIYRNTMYGLRSVITQRGADEVSVPYSTLFNVFQHNNYLSKCMKRKPNPKTGLPSLFEPVTEFLRHSYRKFAVVHFSNYWNVLPRGVWKNQLDHSLKTSPDTIQECTKAARRYGLFSEVEALLDKEVEIERLNNRGSLPGYLESFKGVQAFCVKGNTAISLRDLRDFVLRCEHHLCCLARALYPLTG